MRESSAVLDFAHSAFSISRVNKMLANDACRLKKHGRLDARAPNPATVRLEFNFSLDLLRLFPTTLVGAQNDDGPGLPAPLNATPHRRANRLTQHPTAGMVFGCAAALPQLAS